MGATLERRPEHPCALVGKLPQWFLPDRHAAALRDLGEEILRKVGAAAAVRAVAAGRAAVPTRGPTKQACQRQLPPKP